LPGFVNCTVTITEVMSMILEEGCAEVVDSAFCSAGMTRLLRPRDRPVTTIVGSGR